MTKFALPLILVFLFLLSWLFFDGWPFGSSDTEDNFRDESRVMDERDLLPEDPNAGASINLEGPVSDVVGAGDNEEQSSSDEKPAVVKEEIGSSAVEGAPVVALRARIQSLKGEGRSNSYREALSKAVLMDKFPSRERLALLPTLRDLNRRLIETRAQTALPHELVEVVSGDNLTRIARRVKRKHENNVTASMIMRINRMRRDVVRLGQKLAVPTGNISALVRKREYRLYILVGETVVADFEVGLGRDDSTPLGKYTIQGKTKNPDWTKPDGSVVPFGNPDHVIGNRWMGFDDAGGRTGYGIHGTVDENSIGKQQSDGCIRLRREDVEAIYRLVPEGAVVSVRS